MKSKINYNKIYSEDNNIEKVYITVTHRTTVENLTLILEEGVIKARNLEVNSFNTKLLHHNKAAVWVCEGEPTIINRFTTGMIGKRGQAVLVFRLDKSLIKKPSGLKRLFGKAERVIESDILLPKEIQILYDR